MIVFLHLCRWWRGISCPGDDVAVAQQTIALKVNHVAGIYIALTSGLLLAIVFCLCDQMVKHLRSHYKKYGQQQNRICIVNLKDISLFECMTFYILLLTCSLCFIVLEGGRVRLQMDWNLPHLCRTLQSCKKLFEIKTEVHFKTN